MDINEIGNLLIALIGTSTFGSLIAGIIGNRKNRYDKKIEYIASSRGEWRKEIKEVYEKIQKCSFVSEDSSNIEELTLQLQRIINPNGYLFRHVYDIDGHIWNELEKFKMADNEKEFSKRKRTLLLELDFLLKEDEDKSKVEFTGKMFNAWNIVVMVLLASIHAVFYFAIRGDVNIWIFLLESILLSFYGFLLPSAMFLNVAQKTKNRKEKTIRENLKYKKLSKVGKILDGVSSAFLIILMYMLLFVLSLSSELVKAPDNLNEDIVLEQRTKLQQQIYLEYEDEVNNLESKDVTNAGYIYLKIATKELFKRFWGFAVTYLCITSFYTMVVFLKKKGEIVYRDKIKMIQLLGNDFYIDEINELILKLEEQYEEKQKASKEIEMILRIVYIKMDEISNYLNESNYGRKQMLDSYADVKKEIEIEQTYKEISICLAEFGKNGEKLFKKQNEINLSPEFIDRLKRINLSKLL